MNSDLGRRTFLLLFLQMNVLCTFIKDEDCFIPGWGLWMLSIQLCLDLWLHSATLMLRWIGAGSFSWWIENSHAQQRLSAILSGEQKGPTSSAENIINGIIKIFFRGKKTPKQLQNKQTKKPKTTKTRNKTSPKAEIIVMQKKFQVKWELPTYLSLSHFPRFCWEFFEF